MSITVKVQYEDKLFKLTQGINSIAQVEQEMRKRYPKKVSLFTYYFDGCIVEDLGKVLAEAAIGKRNSVKLVAKMGEDVSILSCDQNASIISIASSEVKSFLEPLKPIEKPIELPKIEYSIPKEFYVCYNCNGVGVYEDGSSNQLCEVCEGRGEFTNEHKYVKRMQILFSHLQK